jgi:hypothetical protein
MQRNTSTAFFVACALLATISTAHAATYWIDSVNGKDTNNGTQPSTPWQTLGYATTQFAKGILRSGDHIELFDNSFWVYSNNTNNYLSITGANNVLIQGYSPNSSRTTAPIIDSDFGEEAGIVLTSCSNMTVDNIQFDGDNGSLNANNNRFGLVIFGQTNAPSSNITIENCNFYNLLATTTSTPAIGGAGIGIWIVPQANQMDNVTGITITGCQFQNIGGPAIQAAGGWGNGSSTLTALNVNNCLSTNCDDLLYVHNASNIIFTGNWITGSEGCWMENCSDMVCSYNNSQGANDLTDGTGIHVDNNNQLITIEDNFFENNSGGFVEILDNCHNICFRYNISINDGGRVSGTYNSLFGQNNSQDGKELWIQSTCSDIYIYNNTVATSNTPRVVLGGIAHTGDYDSHSITGVKIQNNIFDLRSNWVESTESGLSLTAPYVSSNDYSASSYNSLTLIHDTAPIYGEPGFQNDFYIPTLSTLLNTGTQVGTIPGDTEGVQDGFGVPSEDYWDEPTDLQHPNIGGVQ